MRFPVLVFVAFGIFPLHAQVTLFEDNFNGCGLASGWTVQTTGDSNNIWYVGVSQNPLAPGQSIDNSCFLFIDDYSTTADTPGYVLDFISPAFDVRPYTTVECTMDVYFRFNDEDFLQIIATDGVSETVLALFNRQRNNGTDSITAHFHLRHDLSLVSQSANTRIILRYTSPSGSRGKYAGIDNIKITCSGSGTNLIREAFDACAKPAGWETRILNGQNDWQFGRIPLGSSAFADGNSMDGSCFVYFDDARLGDGAPPSAIRLCSPWFDADTFFHYTLSLDFILRYGGTESIAIFAQTSPTDSIELFRRNAGSVGGPFFPEYVPLVFDLSPYRAPQMRIIFEFSDGGGWGYWTGIDNVKVTAHGVANELCTQAVPLLTGDTCRAGDNTTAVFSGPAATCAGPGAGCLWYSWDADFDGIAQLSAPADFNNVVSIFTGTCANPQTLVCNNRDEHGFEGESTWFQANAGTRYLIRVSGHADGFGLPAGHVCLGLAQAAAFPDTPANDGCAGAKTLAVNQPCPGDNNRNATTAQPLPSGNVLARADVWYAFTAGSLAPGEHYELRSNATFSDVITAYAGGCAALQEIAGNPNGRRLELPDLTPGQTYLLQIAGNMATIEDSLCPQILIKPAGLVANDSCLTAVNVPVGGPCVAGNNMSAGYSGYKPSCAVSVDRDIWFKFTAPASGSVRLNTGADFRHTLAVWQGNCDSLRQVFCTLNPKRCEGYVSLGSLAAGRTYYVQVASWTDAPGLPGGNVCLRILDGALPTGFQPLRLQALAPCIGADSALLYVHATGGAPPYTFAGTAPGQVLSGGQPYRVVVTDASGCEQYKDGVADDCTDNTCSAMATVFPQQMSCPGASTGVLVAQPGGGDGPFAYFWSDGDTTSTNTGLAPGTYTVTVTDARGCPATASATVGTQLPPSVTIHGILKFCPGDSTILTASGGSTYAWSTGATAASAALTATGTYTVTLTDVFGCTNSATTTVTAWTADDLPPARVALKVFLQGPYVSAAQLMHDSLRVKNLIPLTEPYSGLANFMHTGGGGGEQTTAPVLAVSGPNAIVDWVFLELHSAADPALVLATRSALLQRDGDVVDVDGVSSVAFGIPGEQSCFIVVRHRNHLGVQLGEAVFFPWCITMGADFRALPPEGFYAYNGLNPAEKLVGSKYVLWAGNGRSDYQLKYNGSNNDRTAILTILGLSTPNAVAHGYYLADFNLDGAVKYNGSANDRNVLLGNVGITTPSAILYDQIAH